MLASQRHLFDLPDDVAYLNCAYMSPLMRHVAEAGEAGIARKVRPWQVKPQDFFTESETARALFGKLIGADPDGVAIVPSASYGLAVAAANLPLKAGQRVLLLADQFPSNVYCWREAAAAAGAEIETISRPQDGDLTRAVLDAIDERVGIAALPNCLWTDGSLIDLAAVAARLRAAGAALALDVTQSLGAMPFDCAAVQPDFLVAASYKWLLGPYSLGFLYAAPKWREGRPLEHNWIARAGSQDFARLVDYQDAFQPGARRYDMGERSNFALMPMAIAALQQILEWQPARIQETLRGKTRAIVARADKLGLTAAADELRAGHFLGLRFPNGLPAGLLDRLAAAHVHVSVRGDSMRVTPHLYNTDADIDRLFDALQGVM